MLSSLGFIYGVRRCLPMTYFRDGTLVRASYSSCLTLRRRHTCDYWRHCLCDTRGCQCSQCPQPREQSWLFFIAVLLRGNSVLLRIHADMVSRVQRNQYQVSISGGSLVAMDGRVFGLHRACGEYSRNTETRGWDGQCSSCLQPRNFCLSDAVPL
jgi:hypothetical protein